MSCELIVVGGSMGGSEAFEEFCVGLERLEQPILIVLHRSIRSPGGLARSLERAVGREVRDVEDDTLLASGVYLAPAGYHLLVDGDRMRLSIDPPVNFARPAIDVLFESAAEAFESRVAAVQLSAASRDGASGIAEVASRGGRVYVQSPESSRSPVASRAALLELEERGLGATVGAPRALGVAVRSWSVGSASGDES